MLIMDWWHGMQAKFKSRAIAMMLVIFSLTTPMGIALGMGISKIYNENSPKALVVEGIFYSLSAGILIYMSLVDLLGVDFMNPLMQTSLKLLLGSNLSLLLGAASMSLLAKWSWSPNYHPLFLFSCLYFINKYLWVDKVCNANPNPWLDYSAVQCCAV